MYRCKFYLLLLLFIPVLCMGCGQKPPSPAAKAGRPGAGHQVQVMVSILPQASFVEAIGGDCVQVRVMIPPGASPATYEPTPSQLKNLSQAGLYVQIGHIPFEKLWIDKIRQSNKNMKIVDSARGIQIINNDPHIWLSPKLVKKQAEHIYQALASADPVNREYYARNKDRFIRELEELDDEICGIFSGLKAGPENRKFMVFHPSWGYFARDYGLEQIAIEVDGKEPSAENMARIVEEARAAGIGVVFASPQFSLRTAEVIAKEIGGRVVLADPLARDGMDAMRAMARDLVQASGDAS